MNIKNVSPNFPNTTSYKNHENLKNEQIIRLKESINAENSSNQTTLLRDTDKTKNTIEKIADEMNKMVKVFNRKLDFVVHDDTQRMMVKVVDTENDKVIREIPPEELLDLVARMQETFSFFIDVRI